MSENANLVQWWRQMNNTAAATKCPFGPTSWACCRSALEKLLGYPCMMKKEKK